MRSIRGLGVYEEAFLGWHGIWVGHLRHLQVGVSYLVGDSAWAFRDLKSLLVMKLIIQNFMVY